MKDQRTLVLLQSAFWEFLIPGRQAICNAGAEAEADLAGSHPLFDEEAGSPVALKPCQGRLPHNW